MFDTLYGLNENIISALLVGFRICRLKFPAEGLDLHFSKK